MSTCFDKLQKRLKCPVPEHILGKVTVATVKALSYLKEKHDVIHRDVKPSNILIDEKGQIKLCDFGISGRLVDSKAKTRSAGCAAYMAVSGVRLEKISFRFWWNFRFQPERIDPKKPEYDIRADVWSLGITLVELATGVFPYKGCKTDFEVLTRVLESDPPSLPSDQGFSADFQKFVHKCLTKDHRFRPKYKELLEQPFITYYERTPIDVAAWFRSVADQCGIPITSQQAILPPPAHQSQSPQQLRWDGRRLSLIGTGRYCIFKRDFATWLPVWEWILFCWFDLLTF
jgi:mitogen-activated protein kinase kinase 7